MKNLDMMINFGGEQIKFDALVLLVEQWAFDRGITVNGKPIGQAIKTTEEVVELLSAVNKNDKAEIIDAIGDIIVTLIIQCNLQNVTLLECLESAYNEIKDRKGYLRDDGVFVKE